MLPAESLLMRLTVSSLGREKYLLRVKSSPLRENSHLSMVPRAVGKRKSVSLSLKMSVTCRGVVLSASRLRGSSR